MSIAILLQQILIIFLEIGTGAAVTKLGIMDDGNSKFLSNLVMSVTLPCTLLASASIDGGREAVAGMLKGYVVLEIFYIPHHRHLPCAEQGHAPDPRPEGRAGGCRRHAQQRLHRHPTHQRPAGQRGGCPVRCRRHHGLQHPVLYFMYSTCSTRKPR